MKKIDEDTNLVVMKYVYIVMAESYDSTRVVSCFDNEDSATRFRDGAEKENYQALKEYQKGYPKPVMNAFDVEDQGMCTVTYSVSKHQLRW